MRKFKSILFSLILLAFLSTNVFANKTPTIEYNGKIIKSDVSPFIENDRTLVPIRFISETLGYKVLWDNDSRKVTISGNDVNIELKIDSKNAKVNEKEVELDAPALIKNERTFVPLRFVAENLKADVKWDKDNFKVIINNLSSNLNLNVEEEKYVQDVKILQNSLNKSMSNLKTSFFENAANLSDDELNASYEKANAEINSTVDKIKNLNVPQKFKSSHEYTLKASEKALEVLPEFKETIMYKDEEAAKKLIKDLTDFQVQIEEAKDSFECAMNGKDYKAQKDIEVYNDEKKKQDKTENLMQDETLKNIFKRI
ncbi:MAG: copper amine oxidase N-terminal domain-containing protein [Peptoniphilus lacydonensis]|uniref:copper amine oxidase N-terminal domain-containing protein n=1 Tax=Peptoniphilus lacydonensis TaxID=1673725 RepID=UPI00290128F5|nr:copper amine oxidase N-terminal domain-containing protein [Peptoniphilus lacydonensis]MDU1954047.1 copper amine oxidase N-terminal domain-containing protein [Peptoniphilus lacydonensis]MDU5275688.1 copper amine oxidase N-terminal domain-containing protein [Peptoniphilus lacydonensis]